MTMTPRPLPEPLPLSNTEIQTRINAITRLAQKAFPDIENTIVFQTAFSQEGDLVDPEYALAFQGDLHYNFHITIILTPTRARAYLAVPGNAVLSMDDLDPHCWDDFVGWISIAVPTYEQEKVNFRRVQGMLLSKSAFEAKYGLGNARKKVRPLERE